MCGGGGSSPQAPDPLKQAEADIRTLQEQYRLDREAAKYQAQQDALKEQSDRTAFDEALGANRSTAYGNIGREFERAGLDTANYDDRINAALDLAQQGMTFNTGRNTFGSDIGSTLLDDLRNEQIREYQRSINDYAPEGFENTAFSSTADDAILNAILGEQFGEASDSILRARDRGTLNDAGFQYAMDNLNTQKSAAMARLQDTGGGILEGYRNQLGDIAGNARTGAGNYDFGDTFDPSVYRTQLETRQNELGAGLEGDIRNAIGGEQFFNTDSLIQKGGVGQGAQNTGLGSQSGGLLGAISDRKKDEEQQRGLGTAGSF